MAVVVVAVVVDDDFVDDDGDCDSCCCLLLLLLSLLLPIGGWPDPRLVHGVAYGRSVVQYASGLVWLKRQPRGNEKGKNFAARHLPSNGTASAALPLCRAAQRHITWQARSN